MAADKITLVFHETLAGNQPVLDWLKDLPREDRHAIGQDLMRLQWRWPVGMPALPESWRRSVGSPQHLAEQPDRPCEFLRSPRRADRAARLHQENAENTEGRSRPRPETQEGVRP